MKLVLFFAALTACSAGTLTNALFGTSNNCAYSMSAPYTTATCPVIGDPLNYDIQKISVSLDSGRFTASISLNFGHDSGGDTSLGPYIDGIPVQSGDLFFYSPASGFDPADPATAANLRYGVALFGARPDTADFTAGDLYKIDPAKGISTETADQALNFNTGYYYRRDEPVLMTYNPGGAPPVASAGTGVSVQVNPLADGTTSAFYTATVSFVPTAGFLSLIDHGRLGLLYSSADCGNGNIQGTAGVSQTPEPSAVVLVPLGGALILISRVLPKLRRSRAHQARSEESRTA